jgi:hypothetical protein
MIVTCFGIGNLIQIIDNKHNVQCSVDPRYPVCFYLRISSIYCKNGVFIGFRNKCKGCIFDFNFKLKIHDVHNFIKKDLI